MKLRSVLAMQRLGILFSVSFAVSAWLSTATVVHCSTINPEGGSPAFQCRTDVLIAFLLEHKTWPYQHAPFTGYWESYDNKLASIVAEPYSRLALTAAMAYLIWFRIVIYAKKRQEKRGELRQQYQSG